MIFECIAASIGCKIGERYEGKIRNKFAIDIKDQTNRIVTHDITKFKIINEEEDTEKY